MTWISPFLGPVLSMTGASDRLAALLLDKVPVNGLGIDDSRSRRPLRLSPGPVAAFPLEALVALRDSGPVDRNMSRHTLCALVLLLARLSLRERLIGAAASPFMPIGGVDLTLSKSPASDVLGEGPAGEP